MTAFIKGEQECILFILLSVPQAEEFQVAFVLVCNGEIVVNL
jgi:hypothetical protein